MKHVGRTLATYRDGHCPTILRNHDGKAAKGSAIASAGVGGVDPGGRANTRQRRHGGEKEPWDHPGLS
jgi:hypothetical protein